MPLFACRVFIQEPDNARWPPLLIQNSFGEGEIGGSVLLAAANKKINATAIMCVDQFKSRQLISLSELVVSIAQSDNLIAIGTSRGNLSLRPRGQEA